MSESRPVPSVVVFVHDVERVSAFYEGLAGMRRVSGDRSHTVLEIDGFQIVVHQLRGGPAPGGAVEACEDSYLKVCLPVDRIAAARERAAALGGFVKPPKAEWEARGFRACDGHDPECNVIQVRESAG
ncbi:MAG: hypothetical protein JST35_12580 [Armatimonadetes bacterium]|nr:hypothetical protein [Armatimonadota bacterium]